MKKFITITLLILLSYTAFGEDIELYISEAAKNTVKRPQVLLIFDNSGSMGTPMTVKEGYDPNTDYPAVGSLHKLSDRFIYFASGGVDGVNLPQADSPNETRRFLDSINSCETARNILKTTGFYTGHIREYTFKGNTGSWNEIPSNNGANITVIDCEDDVLNSDPTNQGLYPKSATKLPDGYPIDYLGTKNSPIYHTNASKGNVNWTGQLVTLYTDNYLRWYQNTDAAIGTVKKTRLEVAKESFTQVINSSPSIDFGLQVFNHNYGYDHDGNYHDYGVNGGRVILGIKEMTATNKSNFLGTLNDLTASTWTPLCETLYEASRYFAGDAVYYGDDEKSFKPQRDTSIESSGKYITPFNGCGSKAFVIMMTDGDPTWDNEADAKITGLSAVEDGKTINFSASPYTLPKSSARTKNYSYLAALAGWMNQHDISPKVDGKQIVETYTIGFSDGAADAEPLLKETAKLGGGKYYSAKDSQQLTAALVGALQNLAPSNESLTSASVAANNFDRTQTLNSVYYSMFEPQSGPRWQGNLKKYKVVDKEAVDVNGKAILTTTGELDESITSYWSTTKDGNKVKVGGIADMLRNKTNRKIYSDLGPEGASLLDLTLSNAENSFGGSKALATEMGVPETEINDYLDWAKGKNVDQVKSEDESIPTMRPDVFGDPLHSKPVVINYGSSTRIVVGTNAGALHMFEDSGNTVDETWAFMPKEFFSKIKTLRDNFSSVDKVYGIDGAITPYIKDENGDGIVNGSDKVWIFFGLRRGGSSYYGIDISDPSTPKLMWHKNNSSSGFSNLGQSWSKPKIAYSKLKVSGDTASPVLFIGGGYDPAKDTSGPGGDDNSGKAVYMLNAEDGSILWSLGDGGTTAFSGTDSVPSDIATLDSDSDGLTDRIYFGDTGGNVWRVDMPGSDTSKWTVFKLAELGGTTNATDRRFFSAPSIVRTFITETIETSVTDENGETSKITVKQEKPYDAILIGSGDRTNPLGKDTDDALFMIKDEHIKTQSFTSSTDPAKPNPVIFTDLYDYSDNPFGSYTPPLTVSQKAALETLSRNVSNKSGWYINLKQDGEKSTSTPIVIKGIVYYLTYTPPFLDPNVVSCSIPSGEGSVYIVDLALGIKKYNITDFTGVTVRKSDERVLKITDSWIDGVSLIVTPDSSTSHVKGSEGSLILGYHVLPVGFNLETMRTSLYVTED